MLSNIFASAAWPQIMTKHFIHAWNPWITEGVQNLAYLHWYIGTHERQWDGRRWYHHRQQSLVFPPWPHARWDTGRSLPGPQRFWVLLNNVFYSHWQDWEWIVCVRWKYWLCSSRKKSHTGFISWSSGLSYSVGARYWGEKV